MLDNVYFDNNQVSDISAGVTEVKILYKKNTYISY